MHVILKSDLCFEVEFQQTRYLTITRGCFELDYWELKHILLHNPHPKLLYLSSHPILKLEVDCS